MKTKKIIVRNAYGWNFYKKGDIELWFSGYLIEKRTVEQLLIELVGFSEDNSISIEKLATWVSEIQGHFAFIVDKENGWCFSAADKICSIPLFDSQDEKYYKVTNYAPNLKNTNSNFDTKSILELSMSGFVMGEKSIYQNITRFLPGECKLWVDGVLYKKYYYSYIPKECNSYDLSELKHRFSEIFLSVLKKTIWNAENRQIVVPLSAGNDSRLVASGLKKLGYENVVCFSYGREGNFEVETSQKIAKKLGYKWIYIKDDLRSKQLFFLSNEYKEYVSAFDSYASIPNTQDIYEVSRLRLCDSIDSDAIIINGSCGDFISGGHVPSNSDLNNKVLSEKDFDWGLFLDVHYSLWRKLRNKKNDRIIISRLNEIANKNFDLKNTNISDYALIEATEYFGRQSRYVINQQRAYDFFGYDWRIPLWDGEVLDFWKGVPLKYKVNQKLYKEVLIDNNWGGVWNDIPVNNKLIRPYFLLVFRLFIKIVVFPFGKNNWHKIEKRVFAYWLHPSYAQAVTSYKDVLLDMQGHRNASSWLAKQYVKKFGFNSIAEVSKKINRTNY